MPGGLQVLSLGQSSRGGGGPGQRGAEKMGLPSPWQPDWGEANPRNAVGTRVRSNALMVVESAAHRSSSSAACQNLLIATVCVLGCEDQAAVAKDDGARKTLSSVSLTIFVPVLFMSSKCTFKTSLR